MSAVIALAVGLVLLAWAADQFVIGAARVAVMRRLPPLVVGAVIIGFGTSTPELLVSAFAAAAGNVGIAVGNIVGSNIANLSLLLGIGVVIVPIVVSSSTVRREAPITVAAMAAFAWLVRGGIGWLEGIALLGGFVAAMAAIVGLVGGGDMPGASAAPRAALLAVVVSVVAWIAMRTGRTIRRWEGVALVALDATTIPLIA